jgi:branched-chain amino acid transport system substrate-binding protein
MKYLLAGAVVAGALAIAAPARAEITVCAWGTITGPDALVNGMTYGTRDYLEYLNQTKGGIAGNKIRVLMLDGRYKLDEELKIYRRCADQEQAVVINGWSTGASKALRDQIQEDGIPFISESFASEVLDPKKYPFTFIAGPTYEQQMIIALRDLAAKGGKKVVLMFSDNEYGRGPVDVVRKSGIIEKLGLEVVDLVEYRYDAQDITAQMLRVKGKNPDLVYVQGSTPQVLVALRDAAKVGLPAKLFVGNLYNISPAIPEQLGPAAEGFRAVQTYAFFGDDIPAMKEIQTYGQKNELEKKDIYFIKGWLKGKVIAAAIEKVIQKNNGQVPTDIKAFRKAVRDELEALKDFDTGGITPPFTYADHQGSVEARVAEIKNGQYTPVGGWIDAR